MKKILIIALSMIPVAVFAASPVHESDDSRLFPYVKHGRVLSYSVNAIGSTSDVVIAVYKSNDNQEYILTGSIVGVERMLQLEFPQGVTEEFVRNDLIGLLLACLGSDRSNAILQEHALRQIIEGADRNTEYLGILELPVVAIKGNRWKLRFMTLDRHGGMFLKVYTGQLSPFELHIAREFALCSDATAFNPERALCLQQIAKGMYDTADE